MNTPLAVSIRSPLRSELRDMSAEVFTTLVGIGAALAVVGLNVVSQRSIDLDFLGLTFWFVVPAGAIIGGLGAASGYYAAARATQTLPSRRMLFEMLAIALSTWLLMHWVEYATLRLADRTLVREAVPFWSYLRLRTEHLRLEFRDYGKTVDSTSELGLLGYGHELLQVAGFLLGGFLVWLALSSPEACKPCSRYARSMTLLQRAPSAVFDEMLNRAGIRIPDFADHVSRALGKRRLVGLNLSLVTCPTCQRSWIRPAAVGMDGAHPVAKRTAAHDLSAAQAAELYRLVCDR